MRAKLPRRCRKIQSSRSLFPAVATKICLHSHARKKMLRLRNSSMRNTSAMNKLVTLLNSAAGKRPLYMCHLVAGYPTQRESEAVADALLKAGADILEVQIP